MRAKSNMLRYKYAFILFCISHVSHMAIPRRQMIFLLQKILQQLKLRIFQIFPDRTAQNRI